MKGAVGASFTRDMKKYKTSTCTSSRDRHPRWSSASAIWPNSPRPPPQPDRVGRPRLGVMPAASFTRTPARSFRRLPSSSWAWSIRCRADLREFAPGVKSLLVVEELDPFLEEQIKGMGIRARERMSFPPAGSCCRKTSNATAAARAFCRQRRKVCPCRARRLPRPPRSPTLCAGCPHRSTFYVLPRLKRGGGRHRVL